MVQAPEDGTEKDKCHEGRFSFFALLESALDMGHVVNAGRGQENGARIRPGL